MDTDKIKNLVNHKKSVLSAFCILLMRSYTNNSPNEQPTKFTYDISS